MKETVGGITLASQGAKALVEERRERKEEVEMAFSTSKSVKCDLDTLAAAFASWTAALVSWLPA